MASKMDHDYLRAGCQEMRSANGDGNLHNGLCESQGEAQRVGSPCTHPLLRALFTGSTNRSLCLYPEPTPPVFSKHSRLDRTLVPRPKQPEIDETQDRRLASEVPLAFLVEMVFTGC